VSDPVADILKHHGVKGMKWGVRSDRGHEGERAKTKKIAKLDKKFERNALTPKTIIGVHNAAAKETNKKDVDRINNKPQYKGKDFTKDSPLRQQYYKEHQQAYLNNLEKAAKALGPNASGTRQYTILEGPGGDWNVVTKAAQHVGDTPWRVKVNYDASGHITSLESIDDTLAQGEQAIIDVLEHHGVKGMKWGRRKSSSSTTRTTFKTAPKHLDTKTLEERIKRMETEKKFNQLNKQDVSEGKQFTQDVLTSVGRNVAKTVLTGAALQVIKVALNAKFGEGVGGSVTKRLK
jgi:hypothetical protein